MRKYYVYVISFMILAMFLCIGYYIYLEYRPVTYQNGTFVELPREITDQIRKLSA